MFFFSHNTCFIPVNVKTEKNVFDMELLIICRDWCAYVCTNIQISKGENAEQETEEEREREKKSGKNSKTALKEKRKNN